MSAVPSNPPIFHITHVNNLRGIMSAGGLWSDAQRVAQQLDSTNIGYSHIKARRLKRQVPTSGGGCLGDYVPFNFCSRSVMLAAVRHGHNDYRGGQDNIVHLVSNIDCAITTGRPWAFTDRHAELGHALYYEDRQQLSEVRWDAMPLKWWRDVKEERQAEFLVRDFFPWHCVQEVAVATELVAQMVRSYIGEATHKPTVVVRADWYYP